MMSCTPSFKIFIVILGKMSQIGLNGISKVMIKDE